MPITPASSARWTASTAVAIPAEDVMFDSTSVGGGGAGGNWDVPLLWFFIVGIPVLIVAIVSNSCAFLVFYKKPSFRKSISNR